MSAFHAVIFELLSGVHVSSPVSVTAVRCHELRKRVCITVVLVRLSSADSWINI